MIEVGPNIGVDPPETRPFSEQHPTVCMFRIIEKLLGADPSPGLWETPFGSVQLAAEISKRAGLIGQGKRRLQVLYNDVTIAYSRRNEYNQLTGYN